MIRASRTTGLVVATVALAHGGFVRAGECLFPESCTDPCPAENSCPNGDADCEQGMWCVPSCLPSVCFCGNGVWNCTLDCAPECVERPVWTGPPQYVIIPLGTLGGLTSVALAVNDLGQVVGGADTAHGRRIAFLWDAGVMTNLGALPGIRHSEAWGVNNNAQVVGLSVDFIGGQGRAFLWREGEMIDLGDLGGGEASAHAINDAGQVVGNSKVSAFRDHSFLWQGGEMTDIGTLGGSISFAWDVNAAGQIVGSSFTDLGERAFIWENGVMTDLAELVPGSSQALRINDLGQAVGWWQHLEPPHAALWDDGVITDLGALGGFRATRAVAINDAGQVVGTPWFLYDPENGMQDLRDLLLPEHRRWELLPRDINDAGQIVGQGFRGYSAFLMTPLDGDFDDDGDTDLVDFQAFRACMTGPGAPAEVKCKQYDINRNGWIDMVDLRAFQWVFESR